MDLLGLLPQFGGLAWTLLAFIVALSVIVAVHEYGHYIVGRWCGIGADVFSIGFGPVLWSRTDRRGTVWQVAALPLGGYVKFKGDGDAASMGQDGDALSGMSAAERETTLTGAALWKRMATVAAGPVFNFVLSIAVFAAFVLVGGRAGDEPVIGELRTLPPEIATLEPGDRVLRVGGREVADAAGLISAAAEMPPGGPVTYLVERDGREIAVEAAPLMPPLVEAVQPRSAAWDIGLRPGDVITAIDGTRIDAFGQLQQVVAASDGRALLLDVWRPTAGAEGERLQFTLAPRRSDLPLPEGGFETRWLIGINGGTFHEAPTQGVGPFDALSYGVSQTWFIITSSLSALYHIVTGAISTCNLSGPIGIAEVSGAAASQGVGNFIWFIAVLSTAVGLLNLFPIPVLDGGHLVFHAYEAVRGRPPSDRAVRVLMSVGIALMGTLMLFAVFNDIFCP
jgi:regulator of sigma E protease